MPTELSHCRSPSAWLHENALLPFLEDVRKERTAEVERIAAHIEMSLTELIAKEDASIGRWEDEAGRGVEGAAGNLKQAEDRHSLLHRTPREPTPRDGAAEVAHAPGR